MGTSPCEDTRFPAAVLEDDGTFSGQLFSKNTWQGTSFLIIPVVISGSWSTTQLHMFCYVQEFGPPDQFKVLHIWFEEI